MGLNETQIQVFENVYAASTAGAQKTKGGLLFEPLPSQISAPTLRTALPGGFSEFRFVFTGTLIDALRWKFQFTSQHIEVLHVTQFVFCGIIEDMDLDRRTAAVSVTARGYYYTLEDQRYDTTSTSSEAFREAVWWMLSQKDTATDWRGSFLDGGPERIEDTGTTVQRRIGETGIETPRGTLEAWAALGDSLGNRYWPAVWDTRSLEVTKEQTVTKWYCRLDQMASATLSSSRRDIWNHVTVSFQDTADGTRKLSTPAEDAASQKRHGLRQILVPAGELSTGAAAQLAGQICAKAKDLRDRSGLQLVGSVLDSGMQERPLWLVRAGDIIEAIDLQIPDRPVGEVVLGVNKWVIRETLYESDADTLTITPEQEELSLDALIDNALAMAVTMGRGVGSTGGSCVTSVNGDSGPVVTLDASDVGADPVGTGATEAASAISAHEAASDPHPQYLTQTEADGLYVTIATALANFVFAKKPGDTSRSSTTTEAADPHLVLSLQASATYIVSGQLFVSSASNAPDIKGLFSAPSGATASISVYGQTAGATSNTGSTAFNVLNLGDSFGRGAISTPMSLQIQGIVLVSSTAGDLTLEWAQNSSSGTSTVLHQNSWLLAHRVQ